MQAVTSRPLDLSTQPSTAAVVPPPSRLPASGAAPAPAATTAVDVASSKVVTEVSRRLGLSVVDSPRTGVDSLASALRGLLSRSAASGKDAVPDVLDAVRSALSEAATALKKLGLSDQQVDKALGGVREKLGETVAASAELAAVQTTSYVRKDKANLDIATQEGDRVQIRFRSREGFVSQTATGATGGDRNVYAFSSGRIEISVDGELNEEELAAIGELVGKVESLANEFFAGDVQKAFESAAALGFDSTQIAGFALKLSTRETLRQETTGSPALPVAPKASAPKPAVPTPLPAPVADANDAAPAATDSTPAAATADAAATETAGTDAAVPADSATLPASTTSALGSFLRKLMDSLGDTRSNGRIEFSMKWKLEVVVAAVNSNTPKSEGTPGTKLLAGSLSELVKTAAAPATKDPVTSTASVVNP